jgi:putative colanic acid biosynthesis acetyltransferase WcaB
MTGSPVIGNYVDVGSNVCIIGDIHIGDHVTIGCGSVVTKTCPANIVVAGNPAAEIKKRMEVIVA